MTKTILAAILSMIATVARADTVFVCGRYQTGGLKATEWISTKQVDDGIVLVKYATQKKPKPGECVCVRGDSMGFEFMKVSNWTLAKESMCKAWGL